MPEHVSTPQLIGAAVLAVAAAAWLVVLARIVRRRRLGTARWHARSATLPALPSQPPAGPRQESVELTPAERDAFAGLVRRLSDGG